MEGSNSPSCRDSIRLSATASLQNKDLLLSLGATHVIDRKLSVTAMKERVARIVGAPIPYIFDAVCVEETQQAAYDLLAPSGTLALVTLEIGQGG